MKDWQSRELSQNIRELTLASQEIKGYMYHTVATLSGIKGEMEALYEQVRKINPLNASKFNWVLEEAYQIQKNCMGLLRQFETLNQCISLASDVMIIQNQILYNVQEILALNEEIEETVRRRSLGHKIGGIFRGIFNVLNGILNTATRMLGGGSNKAQKLLEGGRKKKVLGGSKRKMLPPAFDDEDYDDDYEDDDDY